MTDNAIVTTHGLDFESAPHESIFDNDLMRFRIGTCHGLWGSIPDSYFILAVTNDRPGNGHLDDVFQWFEYSSKRDGKNLLVLECTNKRFYAHLLAKRGFRSLDKRKDNCIKVFNKGLYRHLLQNGNAILAPGTLRCL